MMAIGEVFGVEVDQNVYIVLIKEHIDVYKGMNVYLGIVEENGTMLMLYEKELIELNQADDKVKAFKETAEKWSNPDDINNVLGVKSRSLTSSVKRGVFKGYKAKLKMEFFEISNYMDLLNKEGKVVAKLYSDGAILK